MGHGKTNKQIVIWVDKKEALADGVDIERTKEFYAARGIRLVTDEPYFLEGEDRWVCPGCKIAWERDIDVWRSDTRPGHHDGWQGICRRCEGTELESSKEIRDLRYAHRRRLKRLIESRREAADAQTSEDRVPRDKTKRGVKFRY